MAQLPCENNLQGVNFCCVQINIKHLTIMKLRHVLLFTVIVLGGSQTTNQGFLTHPVGRLFAELGRVVQNWVKITQG